MSAQEFLAPGRAVWLMKDEVPTEMIVCKVTSSRWTTKWDHDRECWHVAEATICALSWFPRDGNSCEGLVERRAEHLYPSLDELIAATAKRAVALEGGAE